MTEQEFIQQAEGLKGRLYRTAWLYLGSEACAVDAVDEAVYQGFLHYKRLRQPEYFATWMTRILINACNAELRRRKRELAVAELPETAAEAFDALPLREAVARLPRELRAVVVLRYFQGLTLAETGQVGLEHFTYLPGFDVYFYYHGDTNYRGSVAFTGGERRGELVRLTYDDTFMGDGYKQVTLRERGEGWQFVSNLAVQTEEKVPLESGLAALPAELADKVVVTGPGDVTEGGSGVLATYYYAPDYNTEWGGLLLQVGRYSQVGFEQSYYSWELTGGCSYLGRSGDWYYACHSPTDVNFHPDHYGDYHDTGTALMAWLEELAAGAGLTPMEEDPFYQRVTGPLSYPGGEHVTVRYYPYYGLSGYEEAADTAYTLVLSQPATQGEEGIWCVDRWVDQNGTRYLVVPETDQPMDDYYAALQDACDAGDRPDLLDPVAVALDFEEDWSGRDLSPDAFVLEGASDLSELFDLPLAMVELENGVGG